jgi:cytochrome c-type biogenesis protein CcmH/NrfF
MKLLLWSIPFILLALATVAWGLIHFRSNPPIAEDWIGQRL